MDDLTPEARARRLLREAQADYDHARHSAREMGLPPDESEARVRDAATRLHEAARALREARRRS